MTRSSLAGACRHFGVCGGCDRLDLAYPRQLEAKRAAVAALLAPLAPGIAVDCEFPARAPAHMRTKLSWPVRPASDGKACAGLYRRGSHAVVAIEECRIQEPALTRWAARAIEVVNELRLAPYDERDGTGFVRALHARVMPGSGALLLGVTTKGGLFPAGRRLAEGFLAAAAGLRDATGRVLTAVGVVRSLHDEPGNALLGARQVPLLGADAQREEVAQLEFRVSFASFWQSHRRAEQLLYRPARAMLGALDGLTVVDGYGGVGAFGLRLAKLDGARVTIVESHPGACADARWNAQHNGVPTLSVAAVPFAAFTSDAAVDVAVVDPPRKGLEADGVAALLRLAPRRVLHVACSATSLARDLAALCGAGYAVRALRVVDLFPHTEHVEVLALLERGA